MMLLPHILRKFRIDQTPRAIMMVATGETHRQNSNNMLFLEKVAIEDVHKL
jgi:hypothetical protein